MTTITNIFYLEGMPDTVEEQNKFVDASFVTMGNVHFKTESGQYFLVRTMKFESADPNVKITKLDPKDPEDHETMQNIIEALREINQDDPDWMVSEAAPQWTTTEVTKPGDPT